MSFIGGGNICLHKDSQVGNFLYNQDETLKLSLENNIFDHNDNKLSVQRRMCKVRRIKWKDNCLFIVFIIFFMLCILSLCFLTCSTLFIYLLYFPIV